MSQSPQAGQFNSYWCHPFWPMGGGIESLNPLKRVNSILTRLTFSTDEVLFIESQSPQAGQFNSYKERWIKQIKRKLIVSIPSSGSIQFLQKQWKMGLSLLEVSIPSSGSIQFLLSLRVWKICEEYNVSIPSSGSIQFLQPNHSETYLEPVASLNPLKRVNSILTQMGRKTAEKIGKKVSIPSSGSIQFLQDEKNVF